MAASDWDFDETPPVESNRKSIDVPTGQCPRCKHLHAAPGHDGASGALGGIVRCWFMRPRTSARLQDKHGKYRRCRCKHGDIGPIPACPCWTCDQKRLHHEPQGIPRLDEEVEDLEEEDRDGRWLAPFDKSKVVWGFSRAGEKQHAHYHLSGQLRSCGWLSKGKMMPGRPYRIWSTLCGLGADPVYVTKGVSPEVVPHCTTCTRVMIRGTIWKAVKLRT